MRDAFITAAIFALPTTALFAAVLPLAAKLPYGSQRHISATALFAAIAYVLALFTFGLG